MEKNKKFKNYKKNLHLQDVYPIYIRSEKIQSYNPLKYNIRKFN